MSKLPTALICMTENAYEVRGKRLLPDTLRAEPAESLLASTSIRGVPPPRAQLCLLEPPRKAARPAALGNPSPGARRSDSELVWSPFNARAEDVQMPEARLS